MMSLMNWNKIFTHLKHIGSHYDFKCRECTFA